MSEYNNNKRLTLNTAGYTPTVFNPIGYKPTEANIDILTRAMAMQEAREKEAIEKQSALDVALGQIEGNLHNDPKTKAWFSNYKNNLKSRLNDAIQVGDFSNVINTATLLAGQVTSDTNIIDRLKANKDYEEKVDETHKRNIAGKISDDTERWWLANNQYDYEDVLDEKGNVIGRDYSTMETPVDDIDIKQFTKDAFDLISPGIVETRNTDGSVTTEQFVTRKQIMDNLDNIFKLNPGVEKSLYQRYEVEQYNLENNKNLTPNERNQLNSLVRKNGSVVDFKTFVIRLMDTSLATNLSYDYNKTRHIVNDPNNPTNSSDNTTNDLEPTSFESGVYEVPNR